MKFFGGKHLGFCGSNVPLEAQWEPLLVVASDDLSVLLCEVSMAPRGIILKSLQWALGEHPKKDKNER